MLQGIRYLKTYGKTDNFRHNFWRDGEQAPGASLTSKQKLEIACQLERLGVDVIEAGFPIASPDDFKAWRISPRLVKKSEVCGLARCLPQDIEAACQAVKNARQPRVHLFLATSKIHLKYKFKKAEDEIEEIAKSALRAARKKCGNIEFSPEDARAPNGIFFPHGGTAIKEGARTINIPIRSVIHIRRRCIRSSRVFLITCPILIKRLCRALP